MDIRQIKLPIDSEFGRFVDYYDRSMKHENDLLGKILEYVRSRRGKMMRPMLVLLSAKEWSAVNESTFRVALSLELFHNASLLHDDVVDESDERRGQKSVNSMFDNKLAVLVGDFLLANALKYAEETGNMAIVSRIAELGLLLSEGEVKQQDIIRNETISEKEYYEVIKHKTAELFSACGELGAMSVGADAEYVKRARRLGEIIGMCFQIKDDIFDYYDNSKIGKPTGNDMHEGKLTLPAIYALKNNPVDKFVSIAKKVKEGKASSEEITDLVDFVKLSGGIEYACSVMDKYRTEAKSILSTFNNADIRDALLNYVDFVTNRDN